MFNYSIQKKLDILDIKSKQLDIPKTAFFDMDNTLLVGDIGELIILAILMSKFQENKNLDMTLGMTWAEYNNCLAMNGEPFAYQEIIKAKEGNSIENLSKLTLELLSDKQPLKFIEGDYQILKPKPKPNKAIKIILKELIEREYHVYVITASSHYIAETVISNWFPEINLKNVYGVKNILNGNILTNELENPFPINEGKGLVIDSITKTFKPLITAGDSPNDLFMFNRTHNEGMKLIVNHKLKKTIKILKKIGTIKNTYLIKWS